jgi:hypothetical protein
MIFLLSASAQCLPVALVLSTVGRYFVFQGNCLHRHSVASWRPEPVERQQSLDLPVRALELLWFRC